MDFQNQRNEQDSKSSAKPTKRKPKRRSTGLKVFLWLLVVIAAAGLLSLYLISTPNDVFAFGKPDTPLSFVIERGVSIGFVG